MPQSQSYRGLSLYVIYTRIINSDMQTTDSVLV